jgi:hypothetical protein
MSDFTIDCSEYNRLLQENQDLKNQVSELQFARSTDIRDLVEREKEVFEYIGKHPDSNKEDLIRWGTANNKGSRVTITKTITNLARHGMINVRRDKPNSQVTRLYINENSALVLLIREFDNFERALPLLVKKVRDRLKEKDLGDVTTSKDELMFFTYFFVVYQQFIGMVVLHVLVTWPVIVKDKEILRRLYAILFSRLSKIQLELTNVFKSHNSSHYSVDVLGTLAERWFVLQPAQMQDMLSKAKEFGVSMEIENIFDVVWKISKPFFRFSRWVNPVPSEKQSINQKSLDDVKAKDWREELKRFSAG